EEPAIVVADAGYWHQRQIEAVVSDGIEVLVPPDSGLHKGARPGWTGGFYDFMRRVLATPEGHAHYRRRQVTIEPVFGQLKFNRQIRRFQRRGRSACRSEWRFIAATHNLLKLHHHRLGPSRVFPTASASCASRRGTQQTVGCALQGLLPSHCARRPMGQRYT